MIRYVVALLGLVLSILAAEAGTQPVEIGYVESLDHKADAYSIRNGDTARKAAILAPILSGDVIRVLDPSAKMTIRLVDRPDAVVLSAANGETPIEAKPPEKSFWSGLLTWTGTSVEVFDDEQRQQVSASIRGDDAKELRAPLLATPQTIATGRRALAIGWLSPKVVQIRILSKSGKVIASGKGVGGLWTSPAVDWKAGNYRIEIAASGEKLTQTMQAVAPAKLPALPEALEAPGIPAPLKAASTGAWLASQDPRYLLEALQNVAPDAGTSRPARLLTIAFIDGKRPTPP